MKSNKKIIITGLVMTFIILAGSVIGYGVAILENTIINDSEGNDKVVNDKSQNYDFPPVYPEATWECPPIDIYYKFGVGEKNLLDTLNNLFIKDMVCDPSIEYEFRLTDLEKNVIYSTIIENDLFNIKDDLTENCDSEGNCLWVEPFSSALLTITIDGKTKTIKWSSNYINRDDPDLQKFLNVINTIGEIIKQKEIELDIEQPTCGYL